MAQTPATSNSSVRLERDASQVPITSVGLYTTPSGKVYILAGEDGDLTVYHGRAAETEEPIYRICVFEDQPVHGIRVHRDGTSSAVSILLWGASCVALLDGTPLDGANRPVLVATSSAPDWIHDAAVCPGDSSVAALATAHNEVVLLTYHADTRVLATGAVVSPSRPMLYASHLRWTSPTCVLVAAGTVFGNVIVWKCHPDSASHTMLFVLRGHEGSVYGVDISPELTLPNGSTARLLASCSDDRTIRVWDISNHEGPHESTLEGVTETGFKAAERYDEVQAVCIDGQVVPVAVAMGHASRIWGVKFGVQDGHVVRHGRLPMYSFGEDSTAQRWDLSLGESLSGGTLSHRRTHSLHDGKHLWARALDVRHGWIHIVIGGADGRISLIEEAAAFAGAGAQLTTTDVPHLLQATPDSFSTREMISRYDFILDDTMLAITNFGRLFLGALSGTHTWEEVGVGEDVARDLKSCYVLRKIGHGAAVIGTTSGSLFSFKAGQVRPVGSVPGRIVEINHLASTADAIELLVHLHGTSASRYVTLTPAGSLVSEHQVEGLDSRFVAVSATRLDDLLVMGSRHGWMSVLVQRDKTWRSILDLATRSRDAITSIVPLPLPPSQTLASDSRYILATSRDGKYRIYQIRRTTGVTATLDLALVHETSPPFGPMIEGAWFSNTKSPQLVLYGFRSRDFVIWNESTREELATINCGGAHRTFRLNYSAEQPERYRLAYTRTSKLSIYSQTRVPYRTVKSGTHGREIRALSSNKRYVASGSEDTSIRIWEYTAADGERNKSAGMRCLACLKAHITGIQKLHWFEDDYLLSSAGNEEFFVWRVRALDSAYEGLAVVCEGTFADKSPTRDLRIMGFDVTRVAKGGGLVITLAFSNSTLKTYAYDNGRGFSLLARGVYTGACITQLRHLGHGDGQLWIVTTSTDGHMALWRADAGSLASGRLTLRSAAQVHQSSIKSLDMARHEDTFHILTGGDDNGLGLTQVAEVRDDAGNTEYEFARRGIVRDAHAASINGVALLAQDRDGGRDNLVGVSVSNDQRIKVWRIAKHDPDRATLASCVTSGVADPGDVAIVDEGSLQPVMILGGIGVEAWSLVQRTTCDT
ncbi:WD repeat protein [Metarhizium album ARSEF 1941]|uniref:WD repeat protein n=1 Tax=Metarhizium album (strain ARSEF 1941) TaxID=1081103 RepID=A0A0B2WRW0_METAS|nr:WD repeat protein [Metarhizium album ARSEF 1941]KHN96738.1 WD repeat protein [Metarhizium album ARSEF 1941]